MAVMNDNDEIVQLLLSKNGINVNSKMIQKAKKKNILLMKFFLLYF